VQGLLLYFPCSKGAESRPSTRLRREWDEAGNERDVEDLTHDDEEEVRGVAKQGPVFRCYWQNRLVPETEVEKLNFFPDAATIEKCAKLNVSRVMQPNSPLIYCALPLCLTTCWQIPVAWRNRIKGFLFFDGSFKHISNNKLKILVNEFDDWLNIDKVIKNHIKYRPTGVKDKFIRWVGQLIPLLGDCM
jgi:hypothetical protein